MTESLTSHAPQLYSRDEHCISRNNIDPDALKIMYRLIRSGCKGYLVGGGVRDLLLGKSPKDFDIATDATPRVIKDLFRNSRVIGRRFKLVHVFFGNGKVVQVATFRDNTAVVETEGEEGVSAPEILAADNTYGTEETDAFRRDLTINGLFYDPDTFSIIDYVGGMQDLREGIVRIIGNPDARYREDPVRLIRVVRHAARSGFVIEAETLAAVGRQKHLLKNCPPMRLYEEVKKDLQSGACLSIFRRLAQTELLDLLLPELTASDWFLLSERSAFSGALRRADEEARTGEAPSVAVILALIALFTGEAAPRHEDPIVRFENRDAVHNHVRSCYPHLAVPKRERERIESILSWWLHIVREGEKARLRTLSHSPLKEDLIRFATLLSHAPGADKHLQLLLNAPERQGGAHREPRGNPRRRRRSGRGPRAQGAKPV